MNWLTKKSKFDSTTYNSDEQLKSYGWLKKLFVEYLKALRNWKISIKALKKWLWKLSIKMKRL